MKSDPTERFSSRVGNYVRYRPGYPAQVLDVLRDYCRFAVDAVVADIGSGTGIFTELLLSNGNRVYGVEPNADMRAAGERFLSRFSNFVSINGIAEQTTLPCGSMDFVTCAQAFHWFDRQKTRQEFARVLRPQGWIVLIWNDRQTDSTPFLRDYELLLQDFATDYAEVRHKEFDLAKVRDFIGSGTAELTVLENRQVFDYEGLRGRLLSSSYAPEEGDSRHEPMLRRLEEIFQRHQSAGNVSFVYDTQIYCAQLRSV